MGNTYLRRRRTSPRVPGSPETVKINVSLVWAIREAECGGWEILTTARVCWYSAMFWNLISRVTLATAVMANPAPNTPGALFAVPDL